MSLSYPKPQPNVLPYYDYPPSASFNPALHQNEHLPSGLSASLPAPLLSQMVKNGTNPSSTPPPPPKAVPAEIPPVMSLDGIAGSDGKSSPDHSSITQLAQVLESLAASQSSSTSNSQTLLDSIQQLVQALNASYSKTDQYLNGIFILFFFILNIIFLNIYLSFILIFFSFLLLLLLLLI